MELNDLTPCDFVAIGEILGNIVSMNLPFNTQNALGNWLCLVGQILCTYNAQQQLYNQGPGVCFDINDKWPFNQQSASSEAEAQHIRNPEEKATEQEVSASKNHDNDEKEIKSNKQATSSEKKVSAENLKEFMDMCEKNTDDIENIKTSLSELNQNINEIMMILYKKYGKS